MSLPPAARDPSGSIEQTRWFAEEVQPHEAALRDYLRNNFPSVDADDVVQESYLKLLKIGAAGRVASTKAYIFSIARNTALTIFRRRKIYSAVPANELPEWRVLDEARNAAETANAHQRLDLAAEAIEHLPPRCREIVRLAAWECLSPAEIAVRLGLSENTVYVQLSRGVEKCARYLRERGERE